MSQEDYYKGQFTEWKKGECQLEYGEIHSEMAIYGWEGENVYIDFDDITLEIDTVLHSMIQY